MVTLIDAFEVPPEADEAFIAGWERARDLLADRDGFGAMALQRALRADAELRFVSVARVDSPDRWREAIAGLSFPAHPGRYEVVHEDGEPDGTAGVTLINPFDVPAESDDAFLAGWHRARELLAAQPGYLGTRLHRSTGPADHRFVNLARWSSPLMFSRAVALDDFQAAAAGLPFPSHPALYQLVSG